MMKHKKIKQKWKTKHTHPDCTKTATLVLAVNLASFWAINTTLWTQVGQVKATLPLLGR